MTSPFEDVLAGDKGQIRSTLFNFLNDGASLYQLRSVSRTLKSVVDSCPMGLFRQLYIHLPFPKPQAISEPAGVLASQTPRNGKKKSTKYMISHNLPSLWNIAPLCTSLTIKVMYGTSRSPYELGDSLARVKMVQKTAEKRRTSMNSLQRRMWKARHEPYQEPENSMALTVPQQETMSHDEWTLDLYNWESIFRSLRRLVQLTLSVNGDPAWPGRTNVEQLVNMLRIGLERGQPPNLRTITLDPIHAAGLIHLRWNGFAAFVERPFRPPHDSAGIPPPRHNAEIWTKLMTLDLRIRNPTATKSLTINQTTMTLKLLEDYLRSFSRNLRCLRFIWLDAAGPSPLALDEQESLQERRSITWPRLAELCLGNTTELDHTIELLPVLAPNVTTFKVLRDSFCSVRTIPQSSKVWMTAFDRSSGQIHPAIVTASSRNVSNHRKSLLARRKVPAFSLNRPFSQASAVPPALSIPEKLAKKTVIVRKWVPHPAFRPTARTSESKNQRLSTGDPDLLTPRPFESSTSSLAGTEPSMNGLASVNEELTADLTNMLDYEDVDTGTRSAYTPSQSPSIVRKYSAFNNALTSYANQRSTSVQRKQVEAPSVTGVPSSPRRLVKHVPLSSAVAEYEQRWQQSLPQKQSRGREPPPVPSMISPALETCSFNSDLPSNSGLLRIPGDTRWSLSSPTSYYSSEDTEPNAVDATLKPRIPSSVDSQENGWIHLRESIATASSVASRPLSKFMSALRRDGAPPKIRK
ncbi:uncharacterized protein MYCFIDRAFT_197985 [Pseudocercospora fijiensis CIRAD86]|uniref:Uncharacterized protein n=1 Tax=Pseudocercospora fijiensis (strain CIRAD86) TaxID=383855 RepID=M2ZQ48_PSEFD|nr:uncharacterized protein MYCFIDRAFT_197985 [Pseudocercospora fijiensis CIRAD86]EME81194.1 hypothetical protein MYCFIDRAFT_197985 [Pseudocercospora fijiensis CIRAD86]